MTRKIQWINDYTVLITTDEQLTHGDEITIEPRPVKTDSIFDTIRHTLGRHFTPDYKYYNIHLDNDTLTVKIIDTHEETNRYVAEVTTPTLRYYPHSTNGTIHERATRK